MPQADRGATVIRRWPRGRQEIPYVRAAPQECVNQPPDLHYRPDHALQFKAEDFQPHKPRFDVAKLPLGDGVVLRTGPVRRV